MMADSDSIPDTNNIQLGDILSALADPLRRQVIAVLADLPDGTERTCASFKLPVSKATLTHHFRVLRHSGLIEQIDRGNSRAARLRRSDIDTRFPGLLDIIRAET